VRISRSLTSPFFQTGRFSPTIGTFSSLRNQRLLVQPNPTSLPSLPLDGYPNNFLYRQIQQQALRIYPSQSEISSIHSTQPCTHIRTHARERSARSAYKVLHLGAGRNVAHHLSHRSLLFFDGFILHHCSCVGEANCHYLAPCSGFVLSNPTTRRLSCQPQRKVVQKLGCQHGLVCLTNRVVK